MQWVLARSVSTFVVNHQSFGNDTKKKLVHQTVRSNNPTRTVSATANSHLLTVPVFVELAEPVPAACFRIRLYFAEHALQIGSRLFDHGQTTRFQYDRYSSNGPS